MIILRITYLWAFVEGGLGGMMHLLHIPFTGFVVGGISIILNVFIAIYSKSNFQKISYCLGLVLLTKFTLSPHSPIGAYIAVSFQALTGWLIFRIFRVNSFSILLYAGLVMIENAIQKPLMAYIVFGDELLQGIDITVDKFFKNKDWTSNFFTIFIFIYFMIYILWSIVIARWTMQFSKSISTYDFPSNFKSLHKDDFDIPKKSKSLKMMAIILGVMIPFFLLVYFRESMIDWKFYLFKVVLWFIFLGLVLPYILRVVFKNMSNRYSDQLSIIVKAIPQIKNNFHTSLQISKNFSGLLRIRSFIFHSIFLNVFYNE